MKEAHIVDLEGHIIESIIVTDDRTGVMPLYEDRAPEEEGGQPTEIVVGYIVAEKVPEGLYQPRWDFAAYDGYQTAVTESRLAYAQAYSDWSHEDEDTRGDEPVLTLPEAPAFWVEGLTQAEIDAIRNQPHAPTPEQQIAALKAENLTTMEALAELYEMMLGGGL
ncbi:hypothetical protein [Cohnella sp. GbtcB17]|uniref:hypothetical protein n=1 Tax=Cohnella sp. GbtcB17 TaxID=2824762 RepID=UPI001C30A2BD|nr:hypothetical protein [Cohnella sp. GbtcB17]